MNLSEFVTKFNGRKVDYDGYYGAQCVDLFRTYGEYVWGIPHTGSVDGAKDLWLRYETMPLEQCYLEKHPEEDRKQGDVIVYDKSLKNRYGHVAIYICDVNEDYLVFEQNGFAQDGAKLVIRNKTNCLGFLRKKNV